MAFVARRNTEGKLVDCQVISGHGSMPINDVSDEDADAATISYSNRSYISPTVRYVASKEEDHCFDYDGNRGRALDNDLESLRSDCDASDDEDGNEVNDEIIECNSVDDKERSYVGDRELTKESKYNNRANTQPDDIISLDSIDAATVCNARLGTMMRNIDVLSLDSIDAATVCNDNLGAEMRPDDVSSLDSVDAATVCHTRIKAKLPLEDVRSLDSVDGVTVCHPRLEVKMRPDDVLSLDSIDSTTICRPRKNEKIQPEDSLSMSSMESATMSRLMKSANSFVKQNKSDCKSQITNRTYDIKSTTVRRDDCSSASTCSWTDMYGGALKQTESRNNIVPSLSLNMSTSSSGSSTYYRTLDEKKDRHGQAAYQEWMKRKERQKLQNQQAAKLERDKRDAETAMRQRLAKERYDEWCRQKEVQKNTPTVSIKSGNTKNSFLNAASVGRTIPSKVPTRVAPEITKKRLEEWDRSKLQQQKRERDRQCQSKLREQNLEKERKQKSVGAWQNWMKSVSNRPKPVPLNQGLETLRGTISNIYVNPIQWVSNIDPKDSRGN